MKSSKFKYIYGPVPSWRLGRSLGIDLLSGEEKVCSFDCVYCQVGPTQHLTSRSKVYVPTRDVLAEIRRLPKVKIDYLTFSGRGEPTLAKNLGATIKGLKKLRKEPIAVLTNATLLYRKDVRRELSLADFVLVKLDVNSQKLLRAINCPAPGVNFSKILSGIKQFKQAYSGRLAIQVMMLPDNKAASRAIAKLAALIKPEQIQICTASRVCAVRPLSAKSLRQVKKDFSGLKTITPGQAKKRSVRPINAKATLWRRGRP